MGPSANWSRYSADAHGTKFADLDQVTPENVDQLQLAWIWEADDMRESPKTTIECNPIIIDSMMYLTSPGLKVIALHAATGVEIWRFDPYAGKPASGVNRGVTYWSEGEDERIFYVAGSLLYALDARTGDLKVEFGAEGKVDLYEGLDRDVRSLWVTAATPGIVFEDLLILGSTLGEGPSAAAPGHIRAFDARTGKRRWIFHTIPHPGEEGYETWSPNSWTKSGGANAWGGFTLDEERGIVFCGTGSATYDHWGGDRLGSNLFANCILALDARSGEKIWHYQAVHHDIWDYDIPCPPNLVQIERDGDLIDAVAQPTKMGHLFVLNRLTGEPLFPIEEKSVPSSEIPGEESWPTQPFPIPDLRYAQQRFTSEEATDLTPEASAAVRARLDSMDTGTIFLPPSIRGAVTLPQFNGGTDWGGAAYHPETRTLFVNASNEAEWISMEEALIPEEIMQYDFGWELYSAVCATCHGYRQARTPGAPSLSALREISDKGREHLLTILKGGKGMMPKFETLTLDEREAVVSYLREEGKEKILQVDQLEVSFSEEIPYYATGHNEFKDPEGFPVNKRPWGTLTAIDLDAGKMIWQVPLGTYPTLEARGEPPTGTFNMGGPAATSGGLIFIGGSMDERFHAYDQRDGQLLWEYQLEAGAYSTPAIYSVSGKQYVVVAGGGGGKPGTKPGNKYYCFSLPEQ